MKKIIITVLGKDRPGIIAAVTQVLFELEFNIEDVRQTILQSEFCGIFIAVGPDAVPASQIEKEILAVTDPMDQYCHIKNLATTSPQPWAVGSGEPFVISTRGPDCKGLVAQITAILAAYQVNVTQLQAVFRGGNDPADNVMVYEVDVPLGVDLVELRSRLRAKARELNLEINFQHKKIFESINRI